MLGLSYNGEYVLNTSIGPMAIPIYKYDGDFGTGPASLSIPVTFETGDLISYRSVPVYIDFLVNGIVTTGTVNESNFYLIGESEQRYEVRLTNLVISQNNITSARYILYDGTASYIFWDNYITNYGTANYYSVIRQMIGLVDNNGRYAASYITTICKMADTSGNEAYANCEGVAPVLNIFGSAYVSYIKPEQRTLSAFCADRFDDIFGGGSEPGPEPPEDTDPFSPGGTSGTGGGSGTFDGTSDPVDIPGLPGLSAVDVGFISLFVPTSSQLQALASYMWSGSFDLESFKRMFADPMDCILGLNILPVSPTIAGTKNIVVGNISTGISMNYTSTQYVEVDCGTLDVQEYWGAYLDYAPYTKVSIYLPYIGERQLDIDKIMGKTVALKYHIDILSGSCIAYVKCGDSVLYEFPGSCASQIPVTSAQMANVVSIAANIVGSVMGGAMSGGVPGAIAGGVGSIVSNVMNIKPDITAQGNAGGTSGLLGIQTPYLIFILPNQCLPEGQNIYTGYPAFITASVGSLSGYTEFEEIHLESISATEAEKAELMSIMQGGVIL